MTLHQLSAASCLPIGRDSGSTQGVPLTCLSSSPTQRKLYPSHADAQPPERNLTLKDARNHSRRQHQAPASSRAYSRRQHQASAASRAYSRWQHQAPAPSRAYSQWQYQASARSRSFPKEIPGVCPKQTIPNRNTRRLPRADHPQVTSRQVLACGVRPGAPDFTPAPPHRSGGRSGRPGRAGPLA